jgi:hypothetical protein
MQSIRACSRPLSCQTMRLVQSPLLPPLFIPSHPPPFPPC